MGRLARFIHFYTDEDDGADVGPTNIVSGNPPLALVNAIAKKIRRLTQIGKCTVSGTDITCNNGTLTVVDGQIVADGTPEEIKVTASGADDQTATASNLFAVGSVTDEQDIISGTITRRCEPVVSDGTTPSGRYIGTVGEGNILVCAKETGYSGAIASFTADKAEPLSGLVAQINPVQDLHGQSNPYPAGGGKNKLPLVLSDIKSNNTRGTWSGNKYTDRDIEFTVNTDGNGNVTGITANGTASANADIYIIGASASGYANAGILSGSYIFSGNPTSNGIAGMFIVRDGGTIDCNVNDQTEKTVTIDDTTTYRIFIRINSEKQVSNVVFQPMIRLASVTDATFAPYSNLCPISGWTGMNVWVEEEYDPTASPTVSVSWQDEAGTVYGGSDEIVGGELTSTLARIVFDGSSDEDWVKYGSSSAAAYAMRISVPDFQFKQSTITAWSNYLQSIDNGKTWGNYDCFISFQNSTIVTGIRSITTVADWRAYLAQNPLEVVYLLATPQTFTHASTQISALEGQNNVWVDTGNVSAYLPNFTTEKVAGQSLSTTEGTNTVFVTSNVDPVELEVEYRTP